ncbi:MAG: tyrosine-type recombinase/integrase [Planctomycetota bacterium]|nr:tyrosine-type recombinase/integrase [bacterium]
MPKSPSDVVRVLRKDLEDARQAWIDTSTSDVERQGREVSSFLVYRDSLEHVLDFHALRHTFISNLVRGGVNPKVAQELARHSTITLTMDRYSHTVMGELLAALDVLPDLAGESPPVHDQQATGTHS